MHGLKGGGWKRKRPGHGHHRWDDLAGNRRNADPGTYHRLAPPRLPPTLLVLALALFEKSGYRQVWGKLVAGLDGLALARPSVSGLTLARRRVGAKPVRALFEAVCGPVAWPGTPGTFWRRLRLVAIDAACIHVPDSPGLAGRYRRRSGNTLVFGYPLLRLSVLVECGTRALIGAVFGPDTDGEISHAQQLLSKLTEGMLLVADAGYDSWQLLADIAATGAQYLCRSGARRTPLILRALPDGSYLSVLGYGRLKVRIIEAWITVTWADGTTTREQWRLVTSLLDHTRYPANEIVAVYHRRWQVETTYLSIKYTILDGRVLRSHRPDDIDQEMYALLTVYQAIVRVATDALTGQPNTPPDRISFTVAIETARDQIITAAGITPPDQITLTGAIGQAVLHNLLPTIRPRAKARSRKNPTSKYGPNAGKHPQTTLGYALHTEVMIFEKGLRARSNR